jgi:type I restriction enzyme S subunit
MSLYPERPLSDFLHPVSDSIAVSPGRDYRVAGVYSFAKGMIDRGVRSGANIAYRTLNRLSSGQIVFARLNAWEGALAIVPDQFSGSVVSPEYPTFSLDETVCDPGYLKHLLAWPELWSRLTPRGSMVRRKRTTESTFLATFVPLPDLTEQRRVVSVIDGYVTQVKVTAGRRGEVERALLESYSRMVFSADCEMSRVGDLVKFDRCPIGVDADREYEYIGMRSFGKGIIRYPAKRGKDLSKLKYFTFPGGALALSNIKAWEGAVAVTSDKESGVIASSRFLFYTARPDVEIDIYFLCYYLLSAEGVAKLGSASPGSADRNRTLSRASFENILVPVPAFGAQKRIVECLNRVRVEMMNIVDRRNRLSSALSDSLLNSAFQGRL